jgi:hypothetical protein
MSTLLPRILLALVVAVTGLHAEEPLAEPLLKNGNFELGDEGWKLGKRFVIEQGGGRNGTRALFFERTDKADKAYASQEVRLVPGKKYRFSAWMRYIRPEGDSKGATLGVEFYENGKFIKATYAQGLVSAEDWKKVEGEVIVPDNANSARLMLQIRKEQLGLTQTGLSFHCSHNNDV